MNFIEEIGDFYRGNRWFL